MFQIKNKYLEKFQEFIIYMIDNCFSIILTTIK